jgi:hypothetical protein
MTTFKTHDPRKNRGTCGSTHMPNVAYKPSWSEKVRAMITDSSKTTLQAGEPSLRRTSMILDRCAARYRASLTSFLASAGSQLWELPLPSF